MGVTVGKCCGTGDNADDRCAGDMRGGDIGIGVGDMWSNGGSGDMLGGGECEYPRGGTHGGLAPRETRSSGGSLYSGGCGGLVDSGRLGTAVL